MDDNIPDDLKPESAPERISILRRSWIWIALLGLVLAGLSLAVVLVLALVWSNRGDKDAVVLAEPAMGLETAPITIVEYGDFSCPDCRNWQRSAIRELLLLEYGPDVVRFVWRNFPIASDQSPKAAEAAHCANEQGKFWDYHNLLFLMTPYLSVDELKAYAERAGLNTRRFDQCLDSGKYATIVEQEIAEARGRGFNSVPVFLINDQPLVGPVPFQVFKSIIDQLLGQSNET